MGVKSSLVKIEKLLIEIDRKLTDKMEGSGCGGNDVSGNNVEVDIDRVSYKEGVVDGICMSSWVKDDKEYVGGADKPIELADMLDEIGSVYGFDGKAELKRVKVVEKRR